MPSRSAAALDDRTSLGVYAYTVAKPGEFREDEQQRGWVEHPFVAFLVEKRIAQLFEVEYVEAGIALRHSFEQRLIAEFDWEHTVPEHALAYRFDIVLRGRDATPMEGP